MSLRLSRLGVPPVAGFALPTTWPLTQNPINGSWTQGGTVGLDWQNTRSTGGAPGIAYGVGTSAGFDDCLSSVQGLFSTTKHYSQATIHLIGGYTPPSSHEVGIWVGMTIAPHVMRGYEMNFQFGQSVQPVRSNGALGDFDTAVFTTVSGAAFGVVHGDIVKSVYDSTSGSPIITLYKNAVQQWQITDTTAGKITTGSPGMSFFIRPGAGADPTKYCNRGFDAGNA